MVEIAIDFPGRCVIINGKNEINNHHIGMMMIRKSDRYNPEITLPPEEVDAKGWSADTLYDALTVAIRRDGINYNGFSIVSERRLAGRIGADRSLVHRVYERLRSIGLLARPDGARRYFLASTGNRAAAAYPVIGILLPIRFSEYITLTEARQRRQSIYNGIVDRAAELGFATMPLRLPPPEASNAEIQQYLASTLPRVNGIIHLGDRGVPHDPPLAQLWKHREIPQVCVSCWTDLDYIGSVSYDAGAAVNSVAHYLKEFGHKKVGIVMPLKKRDRVRCHYDMDDTDELKSLFETAGMEIRSEWIFNGSLGQLGDFRKQLDRQLQKWFETLLRQDDCPTAFWCRGDLAALSLVRLIQQADYRVPDDFSVIGMDDVREAETGTPALTTLRQPNYDSGVYAVNMLYDVIRYGAENSVLTKKLPMTLIARGSVGTCRRAKELPLMYGVY